MLSRAPFGRYTFLDLTIPPRTKDEPCDFVSGEPPLARLALGWQDDFNDLGTQPPLPVIVHSRSEFLQAAARHRVGLAARGVGFACLPRYTSQAHVTEIIQQKTYPTSGLLGLRVLGRYVSCVQS
jgi:hypothetical protein